jgi:hypothetical protein
VKEKETREPHQPLLTVKIVERGDPSGDRWQAALRLLLDAGQPADDDGEPEP